MTEENESTVVSEESAAPEAATGEETKEKKRTDKSDKKKQAETAALKERISSLEAELNDTKDKYMRTAAEYENYRRRTAKEKEAIYTDAQFDVLGGLLPLADNIERAAQAAGDSEAIAKGISMMESAMRELLEKYGIERFGEVGQQFDPNLHNAVMHDEDESAGENEISAVFACGYKKGDRVLRYAMVKTVN